MGLRGIIISPKIIYRSLNAYKIAQYHTSLGNAN